MSERLQKLISAAGLASRRAAEKMIVDGRVTVNGETALLGQSADPEWDTVCVDGSPLIFPPAHTYIILNKPRGYVTTLHDERGRPTVAELVSGAGARLYPVGRLDMYSEGLLLMTDDGALAQRLTHPSHAVDKAYEAIVSGSALHLALPVLRSELVIDGYPIRPAAVEVLKTDGERHTLGITIHEGRNRQIRKMCDAAGLKVHRLRRVAEGPLRLGELKPGTWRALTPEELRALERLAY